MAKAVKKQVRKKKRERKNIERGQAHIQSTFNNTLVTLTDLNGNALSWSSAGSLGFKYTLRVLVPVVNPQSELCRQLVWKSP